MRIDDNRLAGQNALKQEWYALLWPLVFVSDVRLESTKVAVYDG